MKNNNVTELSKLVNCDICGETAHYDAKTTMTVWAYLCQRCFKEFGVGLGIGKGQIIKYNIGKKEDF